MTDHKEEKTYTQQEALEASKKYFNDNELAAQAFVGKYALRNKNGELVELTPRQMHERLAKEFARIEQKYPNSLSYETILNYLDKFAQIIPQGSPMAGIGNTHQLMSLSNCFVVAAPYDSYGGILFTDQEEAQIMKRRGGVGFDISTIRPQGMTTANAAQTTDGIGVFMERFSNTCREVAQGGRRGALMLTISCHHPEILTFIKIKRDLKKVTGANISIRFTDEFMRAVQKNEKVQLRWPVEADIPVISTYVDANEIWREVINSAWMSAEPGVLFWDTATKQTPSDCYKIKGFGSVSTNPCFSEDTLIAVADGRGVVPIKQLAIEGKDVPVYSVDKVSGLVSIKTGRNPRITGYNKKLVRVKLDDGTWFDVTPDHKCLLRDGTEILAKDLKSGDSLPRFIKRKEKVNKGGNDYFLLHCDTREYKNKRVFEHRMIAEFHEPEKWKLMYNEQKQNGWIKGGLTVHHKDYNSLNNAPENLQIMTFKDHTKLHAEVDTKGEKNGRYSGFTTKELEEHAIKLTNQLGHRFSILEWQAYAKINGLPQTFSEFRKNDYINPIQLAKYAATQCGIEFAEEDPRVVKTYQKMLAQGYNAQIVDGEVLVERECEWCHHSFTIEHGRREVCFCSPKCASFHLNSSEEKRKKLQDGQDKFFKEKGTNQKEKQVKIYSQLKFELKRQPLMKEWIQACKKEKVPHRIGRILKNGFQTYEELVDAGNLYNHKVVSVEELDGDHIVYNITVDDNHTLAIIPQNKNLTLTSESALDGIFLANCGEIILSEYDSCRLLLVNCMGFVKDAFLPNAKIDWEAFDRACYDAQRLMDDMIDLELEHIEKIIQKIDTDKEPEFVKLAEKNLWQKIKTACEQGRRTGLGLTAVGDLLAAIGLRYGDKESIDLIEKLYKTMEVASYRASVHMAKERGSFPAFSLELEQTSEFINRVINSEDGLRKLYEQYGRRNIANTTTPPAGTSSLVACLSKEANIFGTTSGIEPAYLLFYKRRKKINPNDIGSRIDFVDEMGDKWTEFMVFHSGFKLWMDKTGKTLEEVSESPYWMATSADVDWKASVDLQAAAQKWICHSISKTCNLPSNTTKDVVNDVYLRAWETGCKGFTIYRDGSRSGVLVSAETKQTDDFIQHNAPKRPKELECAVYNCTVQGEKWTFFVGLLNDKPYEIMGGLAKYVKLPRRVTTGKVIKHNGNINPARYDFHYDYKNPEDEVIIQDIGNVFENPTHSGFTRMVSLSLRHGTPVQYVVEQLSKAADKESDLFSITKAVIRALKSFIKDGTQVGTSKKCPECKSDKLAYKDGCVQCLDCGHSKCN